MAIFGPKPWVTPLEKCQCFDFLNFYSLERHFLVLEYRKRHFPVVYCLKKKVGKMVIFGPNPWVNPFGKISIFRLFQPVVFIAQKGVFSFQNIVKEIFLAYIVYKINFEKWRFLDQKHGLFPLEKCQFLDCLTSLFLQPRKAFFRSRIQ